MARIVGRKYYYKPPFDCHLRPCAGDLRQPRGAERRQKVLYHEKINFLLCHPRVSGDLEEKEMSMRVYPCPAASTGKA
ncbi:hypothetical protein IM40_07025 [Candidatus Paracaedimonas acanthamoebae]|nr:hypothetical protein IM40_07025 [Candidatus Paracaedimonas acanthamoebae]